MNTTREQELVNPRLRRRRRATTTILGVLLMCVAFMPQWTFVAWTLEHGLQRGFDSGKSAYMNCITSMMLTLDLVVLLAWLHVRPIMTAWALVPPVTVLAGTAAAIPVGYLFAGIVIPLF